VDRDSGRISQSDASTGNLCARRIDNIAGNASSFGSANRRDQSKERDQNAGADETFEHAKLSVVAERLRCPTSRALIGW
jgi:hypothetical protein